MSSFTNRVFAIALLALLIAGPAVAVSEKSQGKGQGAAKGKGQSAAKGKGTGAAKGKGQGPSLQVCLTAKASDDPTAVVGTDWIYLTTDEIEANAALGAYVDTQASTLTAAGCTFVDTVINTACSLTTAESVSTEFKALGKWKCGKKASNSHFTGTYVEVLTPPVV